MADVSMLSWDNAETAVNVFLICIIGVLSYLLLFPKKAKAVPKKVKKEPVVQRTFTLAELAQFTGKPLRGGAGGERGGGGKGATIEATDGEAVTKQKTKKEWDEGIQERRGGSSTTVSARAEAMEEEGKKKKIEYEPIYLGVRGKVYDVSSRRDLYADDGIYAGFAGKDATRALALQSTEEADLNNSSTEGLFFTHWDNLFSWEQTYQSQYAVVGTVVGQEKMARGEGGKKEGKKAAIPSKEEMSEQKVL